MQRRPLAQLVEQLAFNQFVEGSNPSRPTNFKIKVTTFILHEKSLYRNRFIVKDNGASKLTDVNLESAVSSVGRAVGF